MVDINRFTEMVGLCASALPKEIFEGLNLGIGIEEGIKYHPLSTEQSPKYIMGEYRAGYRMGRGIMLFYGSFRALFAGLEEEDWMQQVDQVLKHELTHHLESRAGERDLELEDLRQARRWQTD